MRASPAFQIQLERFGLWRTGVIFFVFVGVLSMLAWFVSVPASWPIRWLAASVTTLVCLLGLSLARVRPMSLRWDGRLWHLGLPGTLGRESRRGNMRVVVDLGVWMLLRFEPESPGGRWHAAWLPAQRRGHEAAWHALRCAVHSPRPRRSEAAAADL